MSSNTLISLSPRLLFVRAFYHSDRHKTGTAIFIFPGDRAPGGGALTCVGVMWLMSSDASCFSRVVLPALSKPRRRIRTSWSGALFNLRKIESKPLNNHKRDRLLGGRDFGISRHQNDSRCDFCPWLWTAVLTPSTRRPLVPLAFQACSYSPALALVAWPVPAPPA